MDNTKLAYMAGIVDGEGSIGIIKQNKGRYAHFVSLTVYGSEKLLMDWIVDNFGGYVSQRKKKVNLINYYWTVRHTKAIEVLNLILPFMRVKKKQAELAVQVAILKEYEQVPNTIGFGSYRRLTDDSISKLDTLQSQIKRLNRPYKELQDGDERHNII